LFSDAATVFGLKRAKVGFSWLLLTFLEFGVKKRYQIAAGTIIYITNYQQDSKQVFTKMLKMGHFLVFSKIGDSDYQLIIRYCAWQAAAA
jgi:hypothetical protein